MGRPIFPYELDDPDLTWLIENFCENNPDYVCVETGSLPVILIADGRAEGTQPEHVEESLENEDIPQVPGTSEEITDISDLPE